tara:strand:- start:610 stop:855 length:246 start_codon:yes stop_codon:yes gene_type:complete
MSYTNNDKKNILNKIKKIKSKRYFIKLFNIINNNEIDYTNNNNGIFFNLSNCSDEQIKLIIDFLDLIENNKISSSETSETK